LAVLPALEAYVQTSIWTEAALGVNPVQFFTGITEGVYKPGRDGGQRLTLPEMVTGFQGGDYASNIPEMINKNMGGLEGVIMTGLKSAGVGIGFNLVKKMTRKARSGLNRQILKPLGVSSMIKL